MAVSTRQALLQALSAAEGDYVSGQQLARQLGVSRAAVHKAAAALTAQGYALEAVSRRGYRLAGGDPFCAEAVGAYPAPVYVYDTLESSNRTAKLLALDGASHGTLVLTGHQSAGRGRLGRTFESPAGKGVYLSVVLRPALPAAGAQTATIGAAVAVCRAVKALCGRELSIKWVNDLYEQGKKVCGILTEAGTDLESGQLEWLVVGIGLNLTSTAADWPPELARKAGSLYPGGPAPVSRAALAGAIARELADLVVLTSDNPRTEEPEAIIQDIQAGMAEGEAPVHVEPDRRRAIAWVLDQGQPGDVIVLAGKGHETYQEINGVQFPMDEREIVASWFRARDGRKDRAGNLPAAVV